MTDAKVCLHSSYLLFHICIFSRTVFLNRLNKSTSLKREKPLARGVFGIKWKRKTDSTVDLTCYPVQIKMQPKSRMMNLTQTQLEMRKRNRHLAMRVWLHSLLTRDRFQTQFTVCSRRILKRKRFGARGLRYNWRQGLLAVESIYQWGNSLT